MSGCLKIDLHVHTFYSGDALTSPEEAVLWAARAGLDGLAITDHDTMRGARRALELGRRKGLLVLPGLEVETRGGHILAICPSEPVRPGLGLEEALDAIRDAGGLAVLAHPYSLLAPRSWTREGLMALDAIEVFNAGDILMPLTSRLALRLAARLGKPMTGGSDAHSPEAIGTAYTLVQADPELDEVLSAIEKGLVRPAAKPFNPWLVIRKWAIPSYSP